MIKNLTFFPLLSNKQQTLLLRATRNAQRATRNVQRATRNALRATATATASASPFYSYFRIKIRMLRRRDRRYINKINFIIYFGDTDVNGQRKAFEL
jgi:hypothetical protein